MTTSQEVEEHANRIAELEAELADANEMLEKCNSKFIVALEAENARLKAALDRYSEELIERCAKVCEVMGFKHSECPEMSEYCADAIRALKRDVRAVSNVTFKRSE